MITVDQLEDDMRSQELVFVVRVPRRDLVTINLDPLERLQVAEPPTNAADILLDLHTLALRQSQQERA